MPQYPENLSSPEIRLLQLTHLQKLLSFVIPDNPFWTEKYRNAGLSESDLLSVDQLTDLPICTKAELVEDHRVHGPYGSNLTFPLSHYSRMHQTSGTTGNPMRWLDTPASWDWFMKCWAAIYRMIGLTTDDRLFFPFSFGPFIGFWAAFDGANRQGKLCIPGGGLSSQARLKMMLDNDVTVVCCTPTYALRLAEVAEQEEINLAGSSVRAILVAGEPGGSIPATRERIETAWGARLFDHWGMTEIGSLGIESLERKQGLDILETECIAEIVDPESLEPVEPGELGELLITNLGRIGSPLIRYRTGDLVKASTTPCPSGRELLHLEGGILGRADDMVTIRGNNVFPSSVEAILRRFAHVVEFRITVETRRAMNHLRIEIEPTPAASTGELRDKLVSDVARAIKDTLNFQAQIEPVACESLPRFELKGRRFFREES